LLAAARAGVFRDGTFRAAGDSKLDCAKARCGSTITLERVDEHDAVTKIHLELPA